MIVNKLKIMFCNVRKHQSYLKSAEMTLSFNTKLFQHKRLDTSDVNTVYNCSKTHMSEVFKIKIINFVVLCFMYE